MTVSLDLSRSASLFGVDMPVVRVSGGSTAVAVHIVPAILGALALWAVGRTAHDVR